MLKYWTGSSRPTTKTAKLPGNLTNLLRGIALKLTINQWAVLHNACYNWVIRQPFWVDAPESIKK